MSALKLSAFLFATVAAIAGGVTWINLPPAAKASAGMRPPAGLTPVSAAAPAAEPVADPLAAAFATFPSNVSPRGWLVQSPTFSVAIPHIVGLGMVQTPTGLQFAQVELDAGMVGGPLGTAMHGYTSSQFVSPLDSKTLSWIKVTVNGPSEVHLPGRSGFGTGPATPTGNFTLSGGITVTAIP